MKLIPEVLSEYRHQEYGRGIHDVKVVRLTRFADDGGSLTEIVRLTSEAKFPAGALPDFVVRQISYSTIEPGVIKAFHVHERQRDVWFVPPEDRVLLALVDVRDDSPTARHRMKVMLGAGNSILVSIPRGVAHGCRNLGDKTAHLFYLTDQHFSAEPDKTDEGRLPWDMVGAEIWEPSKD